MTELEDKLDSPQKADSELGEPLDVLVEDLDAEDEGGDSGDDEDVFIQMLDTF